MNKCDISLLTIRLRWWAINQIARYIVRLFVGPNVDCGYYTIQIFEFHTQMEKIGIFNVACL